MNSTLIVACEPSGLPGRVEYRPDPENVLNAIGSHEKGASRGLDALFNLRWKFSRDGWDFRCHIRKGVWGLFEKSKEGYPGGPIFATLERL